MVSLFVLVAQKSNCIHQVNSFIFYTVTVQISVQVSWFGNGEETEGNKERCTTALHRTILRCPFSISLFFPTLSHSDPTTTHTFAFTLVFPCLS